MRILIALLLFISSRAFACPNLAGSYKCHYGVDQTSTTDMVVTQKIQNRTTVYRFTSFNPGTQESETETYKADGKVVIETVREPESDMVFKMKTVASCKENALNINVDLSVNEIEVGWSKVKVSKDESLLTIDTTTYDDERERTYKKICL